jgi:hypothetical protein
MKKLVLALCAMGAATLATPAMAAGEVTMGADCSVVGLDDTMPTASKCTGYFDGNLLSGNQQNTALLTSTLAGLGIAYTGNFADYTTFSDLKGLTDLSSLFGTLSGNQVIAIHYGAGARLDGNNDVTAFYTFDGLAAGSNIYLTNGSSSSATLFTRTPAVPEPATWAMMLLGFGAIGMASRRSRKPVLAQIA